MEDPLEERERNTEPLAEAQRLLAAGNTNVFVPYERPPRALFRRKEEPPGIAGRKVVVELAFTLAHLLLAHLERSRCVALWILLVWLLGEWIDKMLEPFVL